MTVARRYAAAALGAHKGPVSDLQGSVQALSLALQNPAVAAGFANPKLTQAQRKQLALSAAKAADCPPVLAKLLGVLAANKRLNMLADVLASMQELMATAAGITQLSVHTAAPLTDMQKIQLKVMVKTHQHSRDVALHETLKPELLGGFRAFFGGLVWDESVAGRLSRLKAKVAQSLEQ